MKEYFKKQWHRHKFYAIFIAFLVMAMIIFWLYFSPSKALTANVYATNCSGDWFGVNRINGAPEVSANGTFKDFNTENSAFYQTGFQSIVCQNFDDTELKDDRKFISARIGLSLAINEIFTENNQINNSSTSSTPEEIINQEPEQNNTEGIDANQNQELEPEGENNEPVPENDGTLELTSLLPLIFRNFIKILPVFAQEENQSNEPPALEEISQEQINQEANIIENNQITPGLDQTPEEPKENKQETKDEQIILPLPEEELSLPADDLTPIFLPPELQIKIDNQTSSPEIVNQLDAILNLRYALNGISHDLNYFHDYPISPALNNGYFYFDLPEVKSFDDLEKVKVSLEGLLGGDPRLISYLDSLWIEVTYEDEPEEIIPPTLEMEKNSWRSDEEPVIKINSHPNHLIKVDSFKKSLAEKLGFLSNEEKIELSLIDSGKQEIVLDLDKDFKIEEVNNLNQIKILRPRSFRPGHYKLKFKIQQNKENAEVEYDFQWGVLAINTNKSIYLPLEEAYLQMAALNDLGNTLCDANLRLSVVDEISGQETIFTTVDKSIEKSGQCGPNNVIDIPDYFVHYQVGAEGKYDLTLANLDNGYEIKDFFEVKSAVPFEVERIGPTRIYPLANYQMSLIIKPNENFTGLITEKIPSSFKIVSVNMENSGQATVSSPTEDQQDDEKIINFLEKKKISWNEQSAEGKNISWQVDWQAGQSYELKYEFDAPNISPYFYLLGPLEIGDWQEARNWQIASDAIVFIQTANGSGIGSASVLFTDGVTVNNMMIAVCSADIMGQLSIGSFSTAIDESNMFIPPAQAIFYKVATETESFGIAIVCTSASPTAIVGLHIYEYRGLATSLPVDGTGSRTGSDSDPNSGDINVISSTDHLLIAGVTYLADVMGFSSWSSSFTERNDFKDNDPGLVSFGGADLIVSAPGIYTTTATRGFPAPGAWRGQIASFRMTTGITVYGTIYSDEGSTAFNCFTTPLYITLKVNGLGSYSGPCITSQGTFAIPGVVINNPDDVVTAYIDGATPKGVVVTKAADTTSDINLNLYQDRAILRHEGATAITNADIAQYDKDQDPDIHLDSDLDPDNYTYALVVDNDTELHIWTGKTFAPGGTVTTGVRSCADADNAPGGNIHIDDSATFTAGGAISVGAHWTADAGATFTHNNYGVTFTSTGTDCIIAANSQNFYDVTFNGSNGGWSFSDTNTTIDNDLTMADGTLSGNQNLTINGGDVTGNGTITLTGGNFKLKGTGYFGGASNWTFAQLNFGEVGSDITYATSNGAIEIDGVLTITTNQTLDAGSKTWYLDAQADNPFVINGIFVANASTFVYTGTGSIGVNVNVKSTTYHHLSFNDGPDETNYILDGNVTSTGNITITDGTLDSKSGSNYSLAVAGSWTNSDTFTARSGLVTFNSSDTGETIDAGSSSFYNIVFDNAAGGWTIQTSDLTATNNFSITNAAGFTVASGRTVTVNGIFTNGVGGVNTTWTGSTLSLTGTSHSINTKTIGADVYSIFNIGANTDIRMWNSASTTSTVAGTGSLYSMDHAALDGELYIYGDYHTLSGQTDYWSYATDFDGGVDGVAPRQVKVYIQSGAAVTIDDGGTLNVKGGGGVAGDITIVGQGASALWNFNCTGTCNVQESTWNYLDLNGGALTVYNTTLNNESITSGTLNVDWYLGILVKNIAGAAIDTGDNDITISENSISPTSTVFVWSGAGWSAGAILQTTGTDENGEIPQPGTNGAIKIREYSRTSAGYTFYKYNINIAWQSSGYGEYDYYKGYGRKYITSTLNTGSSEDKCISELWLRGDIDVQNLPAQAHDEPPTNGTWYLWMISGLSFEIDDYSINFAALVPGGSPTNVTSTLTVSSSASNGYVIYLWSTQAMTRSGGSETIADWSGTNEIPTEWIEGVYGFGYTTDDNDLTGGISSRFQNGTKFAGFVHTGPGDPVADRTAPSSLQVNTITYRIAAEPTQLAGTYTTTIVYVVVPNY